MTIQYVQGKPLFTSLQPPLKQYPYVTESFTTDVLIVGGGVTGSIIGYYFSKEGIETALIEKHRVAYGSTSVTTSLLQYELDDNASDLQHLLGEEGIKQGYNLSLQALDDIEQFAHEYGNTFDFHRRDSFLYTDVPEKAMQIDEEFVFRQKIGLPVSLFDSTNNPFSFPISKGLLAKNGGGILNPYQFTHSLLEVATTHNGLRVFENTEVRAIERHDDGIVLHLPYGMRIHAKTVIVATGYNTALFSSRTFAKKTTTYNIVTKPLPTLEGWYKEAVIRDLNKPYHYLRTTSDKRIIMGGEDIPLSKQNASEDEAYIRYGVLEKKLRHMFPHLPIEVDYRYCGVFGSTLDNLGVMGPEEHDPHVWYGLGYGANGILFAMVGGKALVEKYKKSGNSKALELFSPNRELV